MGQQKIYKMEVTFKAESSQEAYDIVREALQPFHKDESITTPVEADFEG